MSKERKAQLPILIALLFFLGVISLGAAVYLMAQEPQPAGASEDALTLLPRLPEHSIATPPATSTLQRPRPPRTITITIDDGERRQQLQTTAATVAEVLGENGIKLETADTIEPAPATSLEQDMVIRITRAMPLTIQVDGQTINIMTVQFRSTAGPG